VFIQTAAIVAGKAECIAREMCRNPIEYDTYAHFVAVIYKVLEFVGCAKATTWSKVAGNLITPRIIQRMFCNRQ